MKISSEMFEANKIENEAESLIRITYNLDLGQVFVTTNEILILLNISNNNL
jgi:hypothetical protein